MTLSNQSGQNYLASISGKGITQPIGLLTVVINIEVKREKKNKSSTPDIFGVIVCPRICRLGITIGWHHMVRPREGESNSSSA
jgi:hypothetical protein